MECTSPSLSVAGLDSALPMQASSRASTPSERGSEGSYQMSGNQARSSGASGRMRRYRAKDRCCFRMSELSYIRLHGTCITAISMPCT